MNGHLIKMGSPPYISPHLPPTHTRAVQVHVILFGQQGDEGLYTLKGRSFDGSPQDTVLAFQYEEEAEG